MNVADLQRQIETYLECGGDPDADVMIAHQPTWPLAETLAGVVDSTEIQREDTDEDECPSCGRHVLAPAGENCQEEHTDPETYAQEQGPKTLWLVAGGHAYDRSPYAPREVFDSASVC